MKKILQGIATAAVLLSGAASRASVIYEGFNYAAGSNLEGANGGSGFGSNAWDDQSGATMDEIASTGLTYGSLQTSGRSLELVTSGDQNSEATRAFGTSISGTGGTSTWISFLVRGDDLTNGQYATVNLMASSGNSARFGIFWNSSESTAYFGLGRLGGIPSGPTFSSLAVSEGQTYLVVGQIAWNDSGAETLSLYVNPAIGGTPPAPLVTRMESLGTTLATARLIFGTDGSTWSFDELRIGSSFADVTPSAVPEPGPAGLALLFISGLAARCILRRA